MNRFWLIVGLFSLLARAAHCSSTLVFEDSGEDWAECYVHVSVADFAVPFVQEVALRYLREFEKKRIVKVVIGVDRDELLYMRRGKAMADYSYQRWAAKLSERMHNRTPLAEALSINGSSILRIRHANGEFSEVPLKGQSPLQVVTEGGSANLLHVAFRKLPYGQKGFVTVTVFFRTDAGLTLAMAQEIARRVNRSIGIDEKLLILFREDSWFIEDEEFPIVNGFEPPQAPPPADEYICTPTIVCSGSTGGGPACRFSDYRFGICRR